MPGERLTGEEDLFGAILGVSHLFLMDQKQQPGSGYSRRQMPMGWLTKNPRPLPMGYRDVEPSPKAGSLIDQLKSHGLIRSKSKEVTFNGSVANLTLTEYQPARLRLGQVIPASRELIFRLQVSLFNNYGRISSHPVEDFVYSSERGLLGMDLSPEDDQEYRKQSLNDISDYLRVGHKTER